jgi:DNA-binding transcriptional MerR regulator
VPDDLLTLAELSERSGVEIRTLRSWMAQGVVPGAEKVGRNARYALDALTRAKAARALREIYGLSLSEIRQDLLTADAARIEAYAAMVGGPGAAPQAEAAPPPQAASAADYLRDLRRSGALGAGASPAPLTARAPAPPSASRLAQLAEALEKIAGARPSRRKARGDVRVHIPVTPDLELTLRGDHTPEDIARFEQIADLLRTLLMGGTDHD